jgi:hypothetical protein
MFSLEDLYIQSIRHIGWTTIMKTNQINPKIEKVVTRVHSAWQIIRAHVSNRESYDRFHITRIM